MRIRKNRSRSACGIVVSSEDYQKTARRRSQTTCSGCRSRLRDNRATFTGTSATRRTARHRRRRGNGSCVISIERCSSSRRTSLTRVRAGWGVGRSRLNRSRECREVDENGRSASAVIRPPTRSRAVMKSSPTERLRSFRIWAKPADGDATARRRIRRAWEQRASARADCSTSYNDQKEVKRLTVDLGMPIQGFRSASAPARLGRSCSRPGRRRVRERGAECRLVSRIRPKLGNPMPAGLHGFALEDRFNYKPFEPLITHYERFQRVAKGGVRRVGRSHFRALASSKNRSRRACGTVPPSRTGRRLDYLHDISCAGEPSVNQSASHHAQQPGLHRESPDGSGAALFQTGT